MALTGLLLASAAPRLLAAEAIVWHADSQTMDVDIDNKPLSSVAADFQKATGRTIQVPPGVTKTVSLKFNGKPMSESVSKILDGLNYRTEGTGSEAHIVVIDPTAIASPTPTTGSTGVRAVATTGAPKVTAPINPSSMVFKVPGKDTGKGGTGTGGPGGGYTGRGGDMSGRDFGGGGGSRDGSSRRSTSSGSSSGSSGSFPSRPPRN